MKIKFKKINPNAIEPKQITEFAGGWDVVCTEIIKVSENFVICNLGYSLQPPNKYKITLVPRSSLTKTNWIMQNSPGLGDSDYLGEYSFRFRAIPVGIKKNIITKHESFGVSYEEEKYVFEYPEFPYSVGDRIGQIYLEAVIPIEFELVDELVETKRGSGGFGSTGN
jgi:dUTP pyrophosphatase